jgi:hypothetical protein
MIRSLFFVLCLGLAVQESGGCGCATVPPPVPEGRLVRVKIKPGADKVPALACDVREEPWLCVSYGSTIALTLAHLSDDRLSDLLEEVSELRQAQKEAP